MNEKLSMINFHEDSYKMARFFRDPEISEKMGIWSQQCQRIKQPSNARSDLQAKSSAANPFQKENKSLKILKFSGPLL